jgi:hypothetical protein
MNNISFDYKDELRHLYEYLESRNILNITAFVRIDNQVKDTFGDYLHVLNILPENRTIKTELGWHPHLYAKHEKYELLKDSGLAIRQLWDIYHQNSIIRERMRCVRMGNAMMDNDIIATLNNMNFAVDSSALPGCVRNDQHRCFDWRTTGNSPYRPSFGDYRIAGDPHHKILEIPMTTMLIVTPYDKKNHRRYINPTIRKELFQTAIETYGRFMSHIVIVFHPDQLMSNYKDDLYDCGMDNFKENMDFIISNFENVRFKSLGQFYDSI